MKAILCVLLLASSVGAADYYVANNGNDLADGTSEKTAWQTLARIEKAPLQPGDTVNLKLGDTWQESLRLSQSGTKDHPIVIRANIAKDKMTTLSGGDASGKPVRDYCIDIAASNIQIQGIRFATSANPERGAIMIWADQDRSDISIRNCSIENSKGRGIWVAGVKGKTVSNLTIEQNSFKDNDGSPIQIAKMKGGRIAGNHFNGNCRAIVDQWQAAIRLWSVDVSDVVISGNTIEKQQFELKKSQGMGIHIDEVGPNVVVKDNSISDSDSIGILVENTQGVQVINNIVKDVDTGIFCYRAGHDHLISRNTVSARSLGIVLQGHRANGIDAGPEIEKNGLLFTKNRIEKNISITGKDAVLKIMGGAEKRGAKEDANVIDQNCFEKDRPYMFQWGDRYLGSIEALDRLAGATHSISYPVDRDISKLDVGAKR